eukprot:403342805
MGGNLGDTTFLCSTLGPDGNLLVGGQTSDSGVKIDPFIAGTKPIILSMKPDGTWLWQKILLYQDYSSVTAVSTSNQLANNYAVAAIYSSTDDICLLQIHRTLGTIDWVTKLNMNGIRVIYLSLDLLIDDNKNIYAAFTTDVRWAVMKFQGQQSNPALEFFYISTQDSKANAIIALPGYDYVYIGGQYTTDLGDTFAQISTIDKDGALWYSYGFNQGNIVSDPYSIYQLDIMNDASQPGYCQFACLTDGISVILAKFIVSDTYSSQDISYSVQIDNYSQCLSVATKSGDCHNNHYLIGTSNTLRVGTINSASGLTDTYFLQGYPNNANNQIQGGFFIQEKAYILGNFYIFQDVLELYAFSQKVGFVMTTEPAESDLFIDKTIVGPSAISNLVTLVWDDFILDHDFTMGYQQVQQVYLQGSINTTIISQLPQDTTYTIVPSAINDKIYLLGASTTTHSFSDFTVAEGCTDVTFTYSGLFSSNPDNIIQFNPVLKYFQINTIPSSSTQYIGNYTLTIEALMNNGQTAQKSFNLEIKQNCGGGTVIASDQDTIFHEIEQGVDQVYLLYPFTSAPLGCEFVYTLQQNNGTSLAGIINFNATSLNVAISTASFSQIGTYHFTLNGVLVDSLTSSDSFNFLIKIVPVCGGAIITPTDMQTYFYYVDSLAGLHLFTPNWPISNSSCGTVSYSIVNATSNTPAATSIITLSGTNEVIVQTSSMSHQGTHNLRIIGKSSNLNVSQVFDDFQVIIANLCNTAVITPPFTIPAQTYIFGDPELRIPYGTMTINKAVCGGISYIMLVDGTILASDITLDTVNKEVVINTTNPALVGARVCQVVGMAFFGGVQGFSTFSLTIVDPCLTVSLQTSLTDVFIRSGTLSLQQLFSLPAVYYLDSITSTCDIEYIVTDSGLTMLPATMTYQPIDHKIDVFDNVNQAAYTEILNVQGRIVGRPTKFLNYTYTINFQLDCNLNYIEILNNSTIVNYQIFTTSYLIDYSTKFRIHFPSCPPVSLVPDSFSCAFSNATDCSGNTLFYFDTTNPTLTLTSIDKYNLGVQTVIMEINQSGLTGYIQLQLDITCDCRCAIITPSIIQNGSYDISNGTTNYIHDDALWVSSDPVTCPITYSLLTETQGIPSLIFQIDTLSKQVKVSVSPITPVGTYYLRVYAKVGLLIVTEVFEKFHIQITNLCSTTTNISPTVMNPYNYTVGQPQYFYTYLAWTAVPSYCTNFIYFATLTNSDPLPYFMVFDSTNKWFAIQTNDVNDRGSYNIKVIGYLDASHIFESETTINVQVPCGLNTVISPGFNISSNVIYNIDSPQMDLIFAPFDELTDGACGSIFYSLAFNGVFNDTYFDIINLTQSERKISIYTNDIATYNNTVVQIKVKGQLGVLSDEKYFNVVFLYTCQIYNLTASILDVAAGSLDTSPIYQYFIGSGEMKIQFNPFTQYEACNWILTYTFEVDGSSNWPDFIELFNPNLLRIKINSNNTQDAIQPLYNLKVITSITTPLGLVQGYLKIPLRMRVINNSPPQFVNPLVELTLLQGVSLLYTFPDIIDNDGDDIDLVQPDLGQAETFISGNFPQLMISPNFQTLGTFKVKVLLQDLSYEPRQATYELKITVLQNLNQNNQTNQTENNSSSASQLVVTDPLKISEDLTAYIKSINLEGLVTIQFNQQMKVPSDYQKFHNYSRDFKRRTLQSIVDIGSHILLLKLKTIDGEYLKNVNFTWRVISFQKNQMKVQLDFEDSSLVSFKNHLMDQPQSMGTLQRNLFQGNLEMMVNLKYEIIFIQALSKQLKESGENAVAALKVFVYSSMALNIAMSASLQMLWGMINTVQMIVHMPLINIDFPANTMLFYSLLFEISNFQLVPSDDINTQIFDFSETEDTQQNFQLLDIFQYSHQFYEQINQLINDIKLKIPFLTWVLTYETHSEQFASVFAIMVFSVVIILPYLTYLLLRLLIKKLDDENCKSKIGAFYNDVKVQPEYQNTNRFIILNPLHMIRRFIFAVTVVIGSDYPFVQIQILILTSLLIVTYLLLIRPFDSSKQNYLEFFNELCILSIAEVTPIFTKFADNSDNQYNLGWLIILLTLLNMGVNMSIMIYGSIQNLIMLLKNLKNKYHSWKQRKQLKYKMNKSMMQTEDFSLFHNTSEINIESYNNNNNISTNNLNGALQTIESIDQKSPDMLIQQTPNQKSLQFQNNKYEERLDTVGNNEVQLHNNIINNNPQDIWRKDPIMQANKQIQKQKRGNTRKAKIDIQEFNNQSFNLKDTTESIWKDKNERSNLNLQFINEGQTKKSQNYTTQSQLKDTGIFKPNSNVIKFNEQGIFKNDSSPTIESLDVENSIAPRLRIKNGVKSKKGLKHGALRQLAQLNEFDRDLPQTQIKGRYNDRKFQNDSKKQKFTMNEGNNIFKSEEQSEGIFKQQTNNFLEQSQTQFNKNEYIRDINLQYQLKPSNNINYSDSLYEDDNDDIWKKQ